MACSCKATPCACAAPLRVSGFTTVEDALCGSLVGDLTSAVDAIRDIFTQLGARQYEVALVWTRWSGGQRGEGGESVVSALMILPTPLIGDMSKVSKELEMVGLEEVGGLRVSEISPRFNEDLLLGRGEVVRAGYPIPDDVSFYWEVFFPRPGTPGMRRRFVPKSAPNKDPTGFQWSIELVRASGDRQRDGMPS